MHYELSIKKVRGTGYPHYLKGGSSYETFSKIKCHRVKKQLAFLKSENPLGFFQLVRTGTKVDLL